MYFRDLAVSEIEEECSALMGYHMVCGTASKNQRKFQAPNVPRSTEDPDDDVEVEHALRTSTFLQNEDRSVREEFSEANTKPGEEDRKGNDDRAKGQKGGVRSKDRSIFSWWMCTGLLILILSYVAGVWRRC
jgi:hypothetical protein